MPDLKILEIKSSAIRGFFRRMMSADFRKLLQDSSWTYASTIINVILQFAETIIVARFLEINLYGMYVLITAYPDAILQFLDFRAQEAMTKYLSEFLVQGKKFEAMAMIKLLWILDVGAGILAFLVISLTASMATKWFKLEPAFYLLIIIYGFGMMVSTLDSASGSIMRVFDRFSWTFWLSSIGVIARFVFILVAVLWGKTLISIIWARTIAEIIITLLLGTASLRLIYQHLWKERRAKFSVLRNRMKEIIKFLFNTNLSASIKSAASKLDVLILATICPADIVGIYKMASKLAGLVLLISDPMRIAVLPHFSKQFIQKGVKGLFRLAWRTSSMILPVALICFVIFGLGAPSIIKTLIGVSFLPAISPLRIMIIGSTLFTIFYWLHPVFISIGRVDVYNIIRFISIIVQLSILWILASRWGASAGAIGITVQYIIYISLSIFYLGRNYITNMHNNSDFKEIPGI